MAGAISLPGLCSVQARVKGASINIGAEMEGPALGEGMTHERSHTQFQRIGLFIRKANHKSLGDPQLRESLQLVEKCPSGLST